MSEIIGMMDSLQRSIPALERSHRQLQDILQEVMTNTQNNKVLCYANPVYAQLI